MNFPEFLLNPVDDLLLFLLGLTLRSVIKSDKVGVRIALYLIPILLKYAKRYYKGKCEVDKIHHLTRVEKDVHSFLGKRKESIG